LAGSPHGALHRGFRRFIEELRRTARGFLAIAARSAILTRATRLVAAHPLRACDAIQLASALAVAEVVPELSGFAVFDRQLRAAAAAEGLSLLPPG
jgi:predicted nucleic acid-binding protein